MKNFYDFLNSSWSNDGKEQQELEERIKDYIEKDNFLIKKSFYVDNIDKYTEAYCYKFKKVNKGLWISIKQKGENRAKDFRLTSNCELINKEKGFVCRIFINGDSLEAIFEVMQYLLHSLELNPVDSGDYDI